VLVEAAGRVRLEPLDRRERLAVCVIPDHDEGAGRHARSLALVAGAVVLVLALHLGEDGCLCGQRPRSRA